MDLFEPARKRFFRRSRKCCFFLLPTCVCILFYLGVSYAGSETIAQERSTLKQALEQGIIHTYAMSGSYPQSLEELLDDYDISYDHEKFIVEYIPTGSNLFPTIDVLTHADAR